MQLLAALEIEVEFEKSTEGDRLRRIMATDRLPRLALVGGFYAAMMTGCNYGFSMYSGAMKQQFGLTQGQLDNINTIPYRQSSAATKVVTDVCHGHLADVAGHVGLGRRLHPR